MGKRWRSGCAADRLAEKEARTIAQQLCAGLAEAHRNRVIHGDLKSNNVILATAAGWSRPRRNHGFRPGPGSETAQRTIQSGALGGTPDYMAPELWKGEKATVASDVYALGVILYELASGGKPFPSSPELPWEERLTQKAPAVNPKWDRVLARCLDPDPGLRFHNADEIGQALAPRSRALDAGSGSSSLTCGRLRRGDVCSGPPDPNGNGAAGVAAV